MQYSIMQYVWCTVQCNEACYMQCMCRTVQWTTAWYSACCVRTMQYRALYKTYMHCTMQYTILPYSFYGSMQYSKLRYIQYTILQYTFCTVQNSKTWWVMFCMVHCCILLCARGGSLGYSMFRYSSRSLQYTAVWPSGHFRSCLTHHVHAQDVSGWTITIALTQLKH